MELCIREARKGIEAGDGGPFGAIVLQKGVVIAKAHNCVVSKKDPTAHAEILAIRKACRKLEKFHLDDCVLFSTCEPCPMCMSAVLWARISHVHYGCVAQDAAKIGFGDLEFYDQFAKKNHPVKKTTNGEDRKKCLDLFSLWESHEKRTPY